MGTMAGNKDGARITFRAPRKLARRLARVARQNGISESDVVRMALIQTLPAFVAQFRKSKAA